MMRLTRSAELLSDVRELPRDCWKWFVFFRCGALLRPVKNRLHILPGQKHNPENIIERFRRRPLPTRSHQNPSPVRQVCGGPR